VTSREPVEPEEQALGPGDRPSVSGVEQVAATVGRWLIGAGRVLGRQTAAAYRSIDPDVRRHVAQIPLLSYSLLGARRAPVKALPPDGHPPLIFVHGLGGSRGDFTLMSKYLWLHGRRRSYRVHLEGGLSLERLAEALATLVGEVLAATGERQVELIAHSLGGLVVRMALADWDLAAVVKTVITLGSPHQGTYPARYADTAVTRELRPDSDLIRRLSAIPWPAEVHGVSFWSKSDVFVLPPESAALEGTDQIEVTPFTHYSYLIDPRCWALVRKELELTSPAPVAGD
jgi:pimeloyl-ACP methyl ester carboxylesterase